MGFEFLGRRIQNSRWAKPDQLADLELEILDREIGEKFRERISRRLALYGRLTQRLFGLVEGLRRAAAYIAYLSLILLAIMFAGEFELPPIPEIERIPQVVVIINLLFQGLYFLSLIYVFLLNRMVFNTHLIMLKQAVRDEYMRPSGLEEALKESWEASAKEDSND